ncbi:hypothetical protein CLAIMM_01349 isoform 2 [Cladophialophora immunda]|nr:hypothetical protein CLAIMM_01349 isoform 2 [Cladophialophora immunda]
MTSEALPPPAGEISLPEDRLYRARPVTAVGKVTKTGGGAESRSTSPIHPCRVQRSLPLIAPTSTNNDELQPRLQFLLPVPSHSPENSTGFPPEPVHNIYKHNILWRVDGHPRADVSLRKGHYEGSYIPRLSA